MSGCDYAGRRLLPCYVMLVERVARSELARLSHKYRALGELRRGRHHVAALPELAHEFPGALRELDSLPLDELDRRAQRLQAALEGGRGEPWMGWMASYHRAMRAALHVKRRLQGQRSIEDVRALSLAREAARLTGYPCDGAFVRAVAAPPSGRLNALVFQRLEAELGARPGSIRQALFPERRTPPHRSA